MALAYAYLAPSLALLIHTQESMFDGAKSFNGDVSSWDVSRGQDFVSACDPLLVQPTSLQEDILL